MFVQIELDPTPEEIKVSRGVLGCVQIWERISDKRRGGIGKLIVVHALQKILPIFVRLPESVENPRHQARGLGWEERPEVVVACRWSVNRMPPT